MVRFRLFGPVPQQNVMPVRLQAIVVVQVSPLFLYNSVSDKNENASLLDCTQPGRANNVRSFPTNVLWDDDARFRGGQRHEKLEPVSLVS